MEKRPAPQAVKDALERLPDTAWTPYERTDEYIRYFAMIDIGGVQTRAEKTEYIADQLLQDHNRHLYEESHGKRFGDGRVVARIPMNKLFGDSEIGAKLRDGDREHLKWWLNKDENRPFRTFRGKI